MKLFFITIFIGCSLFGQTIEQLTGYEKEFLKFDVKGSFSLYDLKNDKYLVTDTIQFNVRYTPASTFKICNSLIGLETGVVKDADYIIPWDSVKRGYETWNKDHNLRTAFANSVVWYYQELARRIGEKQMKEYVEKIPYGNADISGEIDMFWLGVGGLRISPKEQVDFLKRLYMNDLPFSRRSMDIVKDIMIKTVDSTYTLRAKTGWGVTDNIDHGWYVGYVEKKDGVFFFATCVHNTKQDNPYFIKSREMITRSFLKLLKIIE